MSIISFNCHLHQCFSTNANHSFMQLDVLFATVRFEWKIGCTWKKADNENVKCNYGNMLLSTYYICIDNPRLRVR